MASKSQSVFIRLDDTLYQQVKKLADSQYEGNVSMAIRALIDKGLKSK